jgi:hypothetical protein
MNHANRIPSSKTTTYQRVHFGTVNYSDTFDALSSGLRFDGGDLPCTSRTIILRFHPVAVAPRQRRTRKRPAGPTVTHRIKDPSRRLASPTRLRPPSSACRPRGGCSASWTCGLCPSTFPTANRSMPALIMKEAAEWRRSWMRRPGKPAADRAVSHARFKVTRRRVGLRA